MTHTIQAGEKKVSEATKNLLEIFINQAIKMYGGGRLKSYKQAKFFYTNLKQQRRPTL